MLKLLIILFCFFSLSGFGQSYTSYFTGNGSDKVTNPIGGICIMGGATEDDNAMKWFLQRADGGDVLVLRTSGSNGYNNYLYSGLGITVNSVETIVCNSATASNDPYIHQKIKQAEAIWFAGGDQWTYVSYWRGTPVDSLINKAIHERNIVIGGTSAGMAIMGKYYFSAQKGTVTSATALANPFSNSVTVDSTSFIDNSLLNNVITDTHFNNPDRKGRLVTFLSRIYADYGVYAKAIACEEYVAVCIDTNGIAKVFGGYPRYDENAYFIQANCELATQSPESCIPLNPLTWNRGGQALKVLKIHGDKTGSGYIDLNTWLTGYGGSWYNWSVENGVFSEQVGDEINCPTNSIHEIISSNDVELFPNPSSDLIYISVKNQNPSNYQISLYNALGQRISAQAAINSPDKLIINIGNLDKGLYYIVLHNHNSGIVTKKIVKN